MCPRTGLRSFRASSGSRSANSSIETLTSAASIRRTASSEGAGHKEVGDLIVVATSASQSTNVPGSEYLYFVRRACHMVGGEVHVHRGPRNHPISIRYG